MTNEISEKKQKLNGRNLCVNAIVCIVSLLVFRFNFIALCLCYIATSIILDQINKRICKNMIKQANQNGTIKQLVQDICNYNYYCADRDKIDENFFSTEIKKLETLKMEQQEREEKEKAEFKEHKEHSAKPIIQTINSFIHFYDRIETEDRNSTLYKIYEEFFKLRANLQKHPQSSFLVSGSFATYTEELIRIASENTEFSAKKKEEYSGKYDETLNEFYTYIENMNQAIEDYASTDAELGIDVLLAELREQNKKIRNVQ